MDIKSLQIKYLDLLKERYIQQKDEEEYFKKLINSKNLKVLKDIIHFWRTQGVENYCAFTATLLQKRGLFDQKIKSYYCKNNFSNYIEEFGRSFLTESIKDEDKLISFTAEFELYMIDVRSGSERDHLIETNFDIYEVFNYIMSDGEYPDEKKETFIIKISGSLENYFCVINQN